jgi:predicted phosphoribosyltransferase
MLDGVSRWYEDFSQTTDEEVSELLEQAREAEQAAFSAR